MTDLEGQVSPKSTFAPFSSPIFRDIWISSMVSNLGGLIQSVGAAWMMMALGASAEMVALVSASSALSIMLLSLLAGALADNVDRRKLMLAAQLFMLVVSAVLAVTAFIGVLTPWALLGFTFLVGCGTALYSPAWQASVGDMVPRTLLPGAVALNSMGFNIARSAGPAVGGAIVAVGGAAMAFLLNALSYLGVIYVLARWRPNLPANIMQRETIVEGMVAGIRYVTMSPTQLVVMLRGMTFGLAATALPALMPIVARDLVDGGPFTFGILLGAFGVGAVGGAFTAGRLRANGSNETIVRIGIAAMATGTAIVAVSRLLPLTIGGLIVAGAGWVMTLSSFNVTMQMSSPRWVVARAVSLYQMAIFSGMVFGSWGAGALADEIGAMGALLTASVVAALGLLLGLRFPLPELGDLNLDLLNQWREPETDVPVNSRSGPVVISIEYRIAEADILRFMSAMADRRRIHMRDGARGWTLSRDLADREVWTERYSFSTWTQYVRHNQRRTQADLPSQRLLRELNKADEVIIHRELERPLGALPHGTQSVRHYSGLSSYPDTNP